MGLDGVELLMAVEDGFQIHIETKRLVGYLRSAISTTL